MHRVHLEWRERILKQAAGDLVEFRWLDDERTADQAELDLAWRGQQSHVRYGGVAQIPRAPFLHAQFARVGFYDRFLPPWKPISLSGVKCSGDDPFHTDWVIGGGIDPTDNQTYSRKFMRAIETLSDRYQQEFEEILFPSQPPSTVHVVVDGPACTGKVYRPVHGIVPRGCIVVLPSLHPKYLPIVQDAGAIITEIGGALAHLAQVGRERLIPIVRMGNARAVFRPGMTVVVDTARGHVAQLQVGRLTLREDNHAG